METHGRPDIQPRIAGLCTRVKDSNEADWGKLVRPMNKYLNGTEKKKPILSACNLGCIKWYVEDASFTVHPDHKSHSGLNKMVLEIQPEDVVRPLSNHCYAIKSSSKVISWRPKSHGIIPA